MRVEDWRVGGLEGWRVGGLEGWREGVTGVDGWFYGRMHRTREDGWVGWLNTW